MKGQRSGETREIEGWFDARSPAAVMPSVVTRQGAMGGAAARDLGDSATAETEEAATRLRFVDFVHPPDVARTMAEAISTLAGVSVELLAVRDTVSAPGEAEALGLFEEGGADIGVL